MKFKKEFILCRYLVSNARTLLQFLSLFLDVYTILA